MARCMVIGTHQLKGCHVVARAWLCMLLSKLCAAPSVALHPVAAQHSQKAPLTCCRYKIAYLAGPSSTSSAGLKLKPWNFN